jgi:hypothetical protein
MSQVFQTNQVYNTGLIMENVDEVKISRNAAVKYATTMQLTWRVNFLGFYTINIGNSRENGG